MEIGPPRNNFPIHPHAKHHILIAGGIGVTPILSMARHLAAISGQFSLYYFARSVEHAPLLKELSAAEVAPRVQTFFGSDPRDVGGMARTILQAHSRDAHVYLCGPRPFMEVVTTIARVEGWSRNSIHIENFAVATTPAASNQRAFNVRLKRRDDTICVRANETIVEALARHGVPVDVSCLEGVCGACCVGVLAGVPDHRDSFLTEDARETNDRICLCVSRAVSDTLVLDL